VGQRVKLSFGPALIEKFSKLGWTAVGRKEGFETFCSRTREEGWVCVSEICLILVRGRLSISETFRGFRNGECLGWAGFDRTMESHDVTPVRLGRIVTAKPIYFDRLSF